MKGSYQYLYMHGTIFDIKKFAIHDGPGIRTTVFFQGCPLNCRWCHNPEGRKNSEEIPKIESDRPDMFRFKKNEPSDRIVSVKTLMKEIKKDLIFYEQSGGGVTFSGGEPMKQIDFLIELLRECSKNNIHTIVDTCGYAPFEDFEKVYKVVDLFLYDLKLIDNKAHLEFTGVSNELILSNLKQLFERGAEVNIRIPLVPGITDTEKNLDGIIQFLKEVNYTGLISLLRYNLLGEDKFRRFAIENRLGHREPQTDQQMVNIEGLFVSRGYEVKIGA